jgi:predicted ribosomally synthesized peptide with SipW-like signal peptide
MGIGVGTVTFFSDKEVSVGNVFTAGTIDISIDPTSGQDVITVEGGLDLKPCQTGWTTTIITNVGPNPAEVWKHIDNVENYENGVTNAEGKYYTENPDSVNWLISNWIHYDMHVFKPLDYSFEGISTTYISYKENGIDVDITVEQDDCETTFTFDFPIDEDAGNGNMGYGLVLSFDGVHPVFQIHNNDGTDHYYEFGTHLFSEWVEGEGYNGWLTGWGGTGERTANNIPVSEVGWISCTGERKHDDNTAGVFTVTFKGCMLPENIYWAVHFGAGGFWDYGGLSKYPEAWTPWSGDSSDNEEAQLSMGMSGISEEEGFTLTGAEPVECSWIYLGRLEPGETMCVCQSYHLDASVDNWGQSDRVVFDVEFYAQQTEGHPRPDPPSPELPGHGRDG